MFILRKSKDFVEYLQSKTLSSCNSVKTFDFSTLNKYSPFQTKRQIERVGITLFHKKEQRKKIPVSSVVLGSDKSYFVKNHSDSNKKLSETNIIKILDFLIGSIFVTFSIPMGTNCSPLFADLFLYYYVADFIHKLLRKKDKNQAKSFQFTSSYILSQNNSKFGNYVWRIYPIEPEIQDTPDTVTSASYFDLYLELDNEARLKTTFYDKRNDFSFPIVNFPFLYIATSPVLGVVRVAQSSFLCCVLCTNICLFVFFIFKPWRCQFIFDL